MLQLWNVLPITPISSKGNTDFRCEGCFVMFVKLLVSPWLSAAWAKGEINTDVTIWCVVMASLCSPGAVFS
jgi:hypothetical protein